MGNSINKKERAFYYIKGGIWIYFYLLIFEGALRKWVLPEMSSALLIIRDPLAIWLVFMAWKNGFFKITGNKFVLIFAVVSILSFFLTIFIGHGNLLIAIYGLRIYLIHFPLIFIIARFFTKDDVVKLGKVILILTIPMVIIMVLQFYSPQSAWINRGVGGDMAGSGFSGALGYYRPSAVFSFTNGNALFWALAGAYILYFWIESEKVRKWLLIAASVAFLIAIPISISRAMFFQALLSLAFLSFVLLRRPKYLFKMLFATVLIAIIIAMSTQLSFVQTGMEAFSSRFTSASEIEGGVGGTLIDRFLGGMVTAVANSSELPFWGFGLGLGSNVGSFLLTGKRTFLVAEGEWARVIGEMGALLGLIIIFVRISLAFKMAAKSYQAIRKGNILSWMLLSAGGLMLVQGQWAQPTALGFSVFIGGLILASLNKESNTGK